MRRRWAPGASERAVTVALPPDAAWDVVASGMTGSQWYLDAVPFRARGALDRWVGGAGHGGRPPGRARLAVGDRIGFWEVERADHRARRLELRAHVRAPGTVRLLARVDPLAGGDSTVVLRIGFAPHGPAGRAYLLADLPARELVVEWVALHLLTVLQRAVHARV